MSYRRALPLTWILAGSARLFGVEKDVSYRIPVALFGTLTVPLLFLIGRQLVGTSAALVAALMLALSEWHLVFSRQARMYVPFLFFFLAAVGATWLWAERNRLRDLVLAAAMSGASAVMHVVTVLAAPLAVIPVMFPGWRKVVPVGLLGLAFATGAGAYAYNRIFVRSAYDQMAIGGPELGETATNQGSLLGPLTQLPTWALLVAALGIALGSWAARRSEPEGTPPGTLPALVRQLTAALAGASASVGQVYAASICLLMFLIPHPVARAKLMKTAGPPLAVTGVLGLGWVAAALLQHGVVRGAKNVLGFPFPYLAVLGEQFIVIMLGFGAVCVWLALTTQRSEENGLRACAVATLLAAAVPGLLSRWGGTRFLLPAYPFLLLTVAAGLIVAFTLVGRRVGRWSNAATTLAASLVVLSGMLGGHGIPQTVRTVALRHGQPVNAWMHMYPFRPDHEAPGVFVRQARAPDDVLIAEDPLQQRWYAGAVDYWFRSFADARQYLYRAPDTRLRDIYVNSAALPSENSLDSIIGHTSGRVWLITSGETAANRSYYLDEWQLRWLDSLESDRRPVFTGRDGVTQVYCVNCSDGVSR
jgi:uncharacterized membrane protein